MEIKSKQTTLLNKKRLFGALAVYLFCIATPLGFANATEVPNELKPFTSDGCSMSPDGLSLSRQHPKNLLRCCVTHDVAYWQGGTKEQKEAADRELYKCVATATNDTVGATYYQAVKYFGSPKLPTSFRWGYGWTEKRGYKPLTSAEKQQVLEVYSLINWKETYNSLY